MARSRPRPPIVPAPRFYTPDDLMEHAGITYEAIRKNLLRARQAEDATGVWPAHLIPKPEPRGNGQEPLRWTADRDDVREWIAGRIAARRLAAAGE